MQDMSGKGGENAVVLGVEAVGFDVDPFAGWLCKAFFGGIAEFPFADVQFVNRQLEIVADNLCFVHRDFKPVGAGRVAGGGDKYAGCAVWIFQIGGDVVFYLDIMPFAFMTEGGHLAGHPADPLQQVEVVRALVEQHTAAFTGPGRSPCARIIVRLGTVPAGDDPVDPFDLAVFSALDQFPHFAEDAVGALVEHHGKGHIAFCSNFVHLPDRFCVDAGGFFAHDVQSLFHRLDGQDRVLIVGCCDDDGVAEPAVDQIVSLFKNGDRFGKILFGPVAAFGVPVGNRGQLHAGDQPVGDGFGMGRTHIADADNAHSDKFHGDSPLQSK